MAKKAEPKIRRGSRKDYSGSPEANRRAAVILEVLAGVRTPTEASELLGVTQATYYNIETKGLRGLVTGCELKTRGSKRKSEAVITSLEKEITALKREITRLQALVRLSRQAASMKTRPRPPASARTKKATRKPRRRKPPVRAVKAVETLRQLGGSQDGESAGSQEESHVPTRSARSGDRTDELSTGIG